jgi:osmotically inducible lipoprotein OsmB
MRKSLPSSLLFAVAALALAACGNTTGDRALSGGMIGAGAGATVGALTGTSLATGALVGGAVGAVGGGATTKRNVNLGDPVWR